MICENCDGLIANEDEAQPAILITGDVGFKDNNKKIGVCKICGHRQSIKD
jgi:hypothetical protein